MPGLLGSFRCRGKPEPASVGGGRAHGLQGQGMVYRPQMQHRPFLAAAGRRSKLQSRDYLLSDWMDASNAIYPYYIKVTGKKSGVAIEDPLKNDKLSALNKGNIKFEQIGNDSVGVTASGKRILKMRFKYESQAIASSIKMSGDPWK